MSTYLADTAETRYVEGPSARFAYRRIGPSGGVPLVLLHRFRATIDEWEPAFLDYLAAVHDVIIFDNVGTGYTDGRPRDSMSGFAEGAIEFIDALGLATVDLLGWSLGGYNAQEVVRLRPELVRKLVVAASGAGRGRCRACPPPRGRFTRRVQTRSRQRRPAVPVLSGHRPGPRRRPCAPGQHLHPARCRRSHGVTRSRHGPTRRDRHVHLNPLRRWSSPAASPHTPRADR